MLSLTVTLSVILVNELWQQLPSLKMCPKFSNFLKSMTKFLLILANFQDGIKGHTCKTLNKVPQKSALVNYYQQSFL